MYKKLKFLDDNDNLVEDTKLIKRTTDNAYIPFDEANRDYQEYLEWLAEGNTPEAADG